ncbi:uncharacterized protein BJ212DRAFT_1480016 [Suillus subaureus]|uniref:Uncharacterized protein n=1 Tax=Suillus subaureus TaxID=48587 RepID=A0A9P7JER8_9AGAM|nr:uncharacterized protein BJ212DRAFT_1480016 [Suillus subaureus]KAG1818200.1 hypothetical protein BJ212DRAFT_1480016 [Suillus subaureus]
MDHTWINVSKIEYFIWIKTDDKPIDIKSPHTAYGVNHLNMDQINDALNIGLDKVRAEMANTLDLMEPGIYHAHVLALSGVAFDWDLDLTYIKNQASTPEPQLQSLSSPEEDIPRSQLCGPDLRFGFVPPNVITEADNTVEDKDSAEDSEEDKDALDDKNDNLDDGKDNLDDTKDGTDTNDSNKAYDIHGTPFADATDHGKIQSLTHSTDDLHTKKKKHMHPLSSFWSADDDDIPSPPQGTNNSHMKTKKCAHSISISSSQSTDNGATLPPPHLKKNMLAHPQSQPHPVSSMDSDIPLFQSTTKQLTIQVEGIITLAARISWWKAAVISRMPDIDPIIFPRFPDLFLDPISNSFLDPLSCPPYTHSIQQDIQTLPPLRFQTTSTTSHISVLFPPCLLEPQISRPPDINCYYLWTYSHPLSEILRLSPFRHLRLSGSQLSFFLSC